MPTPNAPIGALLEDAERYRQYALLVRSVHYRMADIRAWVGQLIGGLTVFAAAVVSTGILTHLNTHPSSALTVAGGVVAFIAAVLAGLQSFFKFGEAAEKHRVAGADYGEVATKLDLFLARYAAADVERTDAALDELSGITDKLGEYDRKGPGFPGRLYDRARKEQNDLKKGVEQADSGTASLSPSRTLRLFGRR